jgi:tetrapyrrole methylase family protein/MazG family protein
VKGADITIVGLGPADESLWTAAARAALESAPRLWLRTARHSAAAAALRLRPDAATFDGFYESCADLPAVYTAIASTLVAAAAEGPVCYGVPGSTAVGERSVVLLREAASRHGLRLAEVSGVSFVEPCLVAVGWDALDGVQIADAHEVARRHHAPLDPDRRALVAQLHDRLVAGDVKLVLLGQYPPDHQVAVISGGGDDGLNLEWVALAGLDHADRFGDETSLAIPPLRCARAAAGLPVGGSLQTLLEMMAHLRSPEGCPWDREQTHRSLAPYLLEEAHEALAAIDDGGGAALRDELGDVLLQVVFHAQVASEAAEFNIHDVICGLTGKIVARHPHVFAGETLASAGDVASRWDELKRRERETAGADHDPLGGIPSSLPALALARQVQERAERLGVPAASPQQAAANDEEDRLAGQLWELVARSRREGVDAEGALRRYTARELSRLRAAGAGPASAAHPNGG